MTHGKGTITTSPPSVEQYHNAYFELLNDAEHIISLHTSPLIAENILHARIAAHNFGSLAATTIFGWALRTVQVVRRPCSICVTWLVT